MEINNNNNNNDRNSDKSNAKWWKKKYKNIPIWIWIVVGITVVSIFLSFFEEEESGNQSYNDNTENINQDDSRYVEETTTTYSDDGTISYDVVSTDDNGSVVDFNNAFRFDNVIYIFKNIEWNYDSSILGYKPVNRYVKVNLNLQNDKNEYQLFMINMLLIDSEGYEYSYSSKTYMLDEEPPSTIDPNTTIETAVIFDVPEKDYQYIKIYDDIGLSSMLVKLPNK